MRSSRSAPRRTTIRLASASELSFIGARARAVGLAIALLICLASGCGGGAPLLHPAHVNSPGVVSIGAGASGQFALRSVGGETSDSGKLETATVAPGVAPWVGGRVGIRGDNEGGLTYTGRAVRVDGRHAFDLGGPALSIGAGASAIFPQRPGRGDDETRLYGGGVDVPVLFGLRTRSDVYALWGGLRGGFGVMGGSVISSAAPEPGEPAPGFVDLDARHFQVGALLGMRAGFRHLHVAIELDAAYHHVDGTFGEQSLSIDQFTLTPGGALVLTF